MIRFCVLDDEHIVATDLAYQLAQRKGWDLAGVFQDPAALQREFADSKFDVCFLDIETPGLDGLSLARLLKEASPRLIVIFVTAYHQYTTAAFRVEARDYLVKPVTPVALSEACQRVEKQLGAAICTTQDKFAILTAGRIDYVPVKDVVAARAAGNYVALITEQREHLHRITVTDLAKILLPLGFLRTHRSYLVRPELIVASKVRGGALVEVILRSGLDVPVSESYRQDVASVLAARSIWQAR
jgi:DNA-binding LytR/AlgR family response regulator